MKILIDARLYGYEHTGIGRYIIGLVSNLSRLDKNNNYVILLRKKYYDGLELPKNWKKVLADFGHYSFTEQLKLPFILYREKADICHFLHFNVPILYFGKYVVTIHDLLMHTQKGLEATTLPFFEYFIKRFGYRIAFDSAVYRASRIIVPSKFVKESLVNNYRINSSKVEYIYEYADILSEYSKTNILSKFGLKNKKYFFYVGNSYPHKNLKNGIEAVMKYNKHSKEKIYYCIATAKSFFYNKLTKYLKNQKDSKYIKIIGQISDNEMAELYGSSVGLLFPTLSEGFGIPGIEAMNYKTLILCSDIEILKEVYGNNAIYFNALDTDSICDSISKVISMSKLERKKRIEEAYKFVKQYSWERMATETLNVYKSTV